MQTSSDFALLRSHSLVAIISYVFNHVRVNSESQGKRSDFVSSLEMAVTVQKRSGREIVCGQTWKRRCTSEPIVSCTSANFTTTHVRLDGPLSFYAIFLFTF